MLPLLVVRAGRTVRGMRRVPRVPRIFTAGASLKADTIPEHHMKKTASFIALAALGLASCGSQGESKAMPELEEPDTAGSQETAIGGIAEPNRPDRAIADETAGSVENELTDVDEAGMAEETLAEDDLER